jgi:ABC-2 type transport system ATP-binding protein
MVRRRSDSADATVSAQAGSRVPDPADPVPRGSAGAGEAGAADHGRSQATLGDGPALAVAGLHKSYAAGFLHRGRAAVLEDLHLTVQRREIFGYIGPNGSGKTTTLKVVLGFVRPDRGSITILGEPHERRAWRYRVGYLPEHPYFYDYLTAREYLHYVGRLFGLTAPVQRERTRALLEQVGLERSADQPLRRFSKGMGQRLGIAQALINDPELVILDEPMSGLDPIGRRLVRDLILSLKESGKTVFFSTHILGDAEVLCDRVGLIRGGRLLRSGRLDEILNLDVTHMEVLVSGVDEALLAPLPGIRARQSLAERWRLDVDEAAVGRTVSAVEAGGGRVLSVNPVRQSLEDYFFKELGPAGSGGSWTLED